MSATDQFTGERFLPGVDGEIAYEHCHRYAFARRFVAGRRVLDAACGEGYGAALLASGAASVVAVDVAPQVVTAAGARYAAHANLRFVAASVTRLPLADASVDVVVSFETIEHVDADDQRRMLAEFARVLTRDGTLVLSSPNRPEYSDARGYANPFHRRELDRGELEELLAAHFPACAWHVQRRYLGSALWREDGGDDFEALSGSPAAVGAASQPAAMYFVVVAARHAGALAPAPALSLYADAADSEWARIDREAREALRLDALLLQRDRELHAQAVRATELAAMVGQRDADIAARDRNLEALGGRLAGLGHRLAAAEDAVRQAAAERERLHRQIAAQERLAAYRESLRWWLVLPLVRARRVWHRLSGR